MRRDIDRLIEMLAAIDGLDLALTTKRIDAGHASESARGGLRRVTVSLDSLDDDVFKAMNDVDFPVERPLGGIEGPRLPASVPSRSTWC